MVEIFLGKGNWQRGRGQEHGTVFAEGEAEDAEKCDVDYGAAGKQWLFWWWRGGRIWVCDWVLGVKLGAEVAGTWCW